MGYGNGIPMVVGPGMGGSPFMMLPLPGPMNVQPQFDFGQGSDEFSHLRERGAMLDLLSGE